MVRFTKRPPVVCKIFTFSRKKKQAYSFSGNARIDGRNISSEGIFFCIKTGWDKISREGQFGGLPQHLLYSVKSACYCVRNASVRLILTRAELLDLQLSLRGAQTRLVSFHPPVHAVIWVRVVVAGNGIMVLSNQPSSCCTSSSILLVSDGMQACWFENSIVHKFFYTCLYYFWGYKPCFQHGLSHSRCPCSWCPF